MRLFKSISSQPQLRSLKNSAKRRNKLKHLGKYFNNSIQPAGSNFNIMNASQGVSIQENGKFKKGPEMKRNSSQLVLPIGHKEPMLGSTLTSQKSFEKFGLNTPKNSQQINPILPNDQHILELTGDYDTLMSGNELMSTKKLSRVASQGHITMDKDFDVSMLFLPEINKKKYKLGKPKLSQKIFGKPSLFSIKSVRKEFKDLSRFDDHNSNIIMNPSWGQQIKAEGIESQNVARKPQIKKLLKLNKIEKLGRNRKGMFLTKLSTKNSSSKLHLPQPPLGMSFGHGILKSQL